MGAIDAKALMIQKEVGTEEQKGCDVLSCFLEGHNPAKPSTLYKK
jgi:hypothetical protein